MNRIVYMVIRNCFHAPIWLYRVAKMGRPDDGHTEKERYQYLKSVVEKVVKKGRVEVEVYGEQYLPQQDGFIMFPNHQGLFDVLALIKASPHPFGVVIKKEAANIILVKQVVRLLRGLALDRDDIKDSLRVINRMAEEVKQGRNYVIFAEGTRSKKGNHILEFKSGTFKSAIKSCCPIIPVALINSFKPFDYPSIRKEHVQVRYLKPIYPDQYIGMSTKQIADIVHDRIQDEIDKNI